MSVEQGIAEPRIVDQGSESVRLAFELAREAHRGETRKGDGSPFISHPVAVAELLSGADLDQDALAAALLHDVVENTELTIDAITERFGDDIGELVAALTEDERIADYERRKDAHREQVASAGRCAAAIYVADKLANLREMRRLYAEVGEAAAERSNAPTLDVRVRAWRRDLEMATRTSPGLGLIGELRRELEALEADREARRA